jgi:D-galactarolactone isomerase
VQFNGNDMLERRPALDALQGDYIIDHAGKFIPPVSTDDPAFTALLN